MMELVDSKIEWIGEIPSDWSVYSLSQVVDQVKNKNKDLEEKNLLSLSYGKIKRKDIESSDGLLPASFDNYNIIEEGDIVLRLTDLQNDHTSLRVGRATERGIITSAYCSVRPRDVDSTFLYYLLHAYDIKKGFYGMGAGVRQGLNFSEVKSLRIALPSIETQKIIVKYLNAKIGILDEIISETEKSLAEYKLLKKTLICELATKGLHKDRKFVDSGIEWIGQMPADWNCSRIKNEFDNYDYLREPISAENRENKLGLYDYYGASGVIDKIDDFNVEDTVLLIGEDGANLRMRNLPLVYKASGRFWVNNHAHILKVKEKNNYDYMAFLLEAGDYSLYITGSAQPKLSQFNLMRFPLPVPPIKEQIEIAEVLGKRVDTIDSLIVEKMELLNKMNDYKSSLIYEVITGKKEV